MTSPFGLRKYSVNAKNGFIMWDIHIMRQPLSLVKTRSFVRNGCFYVHGEIHFHAYSAIETDVFRAGLRWTLRKGWIAVDSVQGSFPAFPVSRLRIAVRLAQCKAI